MFKHLQHKHKVHYFPNEHRPWKRQPLVLDNPQEPTIPITHQSNHIPVMLNLHPELNPNLQTGHFNLHDKRTLAASHSTD
jgi:hypothetical protein